MSNLFLPLAGLPGWSATAGLWMPDRRGAPRFLRTIACLAEPRRRYTLDTDGPGAFDLIVAGFAARLSSAEGAA